MNNVNLIGNLCKDWEIKTTKTGKVVASNSMAVRKNKEEAVFVQIRAWQGTADLLVNYTQKGDKLGITGRLDVDTYNKDGKLNYFTYVTIEEIEFCNGRKKEKE